MELVARLKALATESRRKRLALAAALVLVALIGVELARLAWLVVAGSGGAAAVVSAASELPPVASRVREYAPGEAADWKLFGDAAARPQQGAAAAPETNLSMQLLGVFSTPDVKLAGAVIAERGKDGELFRIGAALPGGATLEKVEKDHVLLRRRGQLETLRFDAAPASTGAPAASQSLSSGMDTLGGYGKAVRGAKTDSGGDMPAKTRDVFGNLADQLRDNADGVIGELGLKPLSGSGGAPGGYQVGDATSDAMRNLGLRSGDVILSVNGKPLGNVQNDRMMVDEVKASGEARVEIRRGSQTFTVNYPL